MVGVSLFLFHQPPIYCVLCSLRPQLEKKITIESKTPTSTSTQFLRNVQGARVSCVII